jgi:hypothetical protein
LGSAECACSVGSIGGLIPRAPAGSPRDKAARRPGHDHRSHPRRAGDVWWRLWRDRPRPKPLTQFRARLGRASPTLRDPLPQLAMVSTRFRLQHKCLGLPVQRIRDAAVCPSPSRRCATGPSLSPLARGEGLVRSFPSPRLRGEGRVRGAAPRVSSLAGWRPSAGEG